MGCLWESLSTSLDGLYDTIEDVIIEVPDALQNSMGHGGEKCIHVVRLITVLYKAFNEGRFTV